MATTETPQPTSSPPEPDGGDPSRGRRALATLGLLVLVASAVFGSNLFGIRERVLGPDERPVAVSRGDGDGAAPTTPTSRERTVLRSQPWWQHVRTFEGEGDTTTPAVQIDDGAVQWRVRWRCDAGTLRVETPGRDEPLVDTACPGEDTAYGVRAGTRTLTVTAGGSWRLEVGQQLDVPLVEPPLEAMTAADARQVATGEFYGIDQVGQGSVTVYRLPDGTYALRLDDFYVTPNTDLEIVFSELDQPRTTEDYAGAPSSSRVSWLDVTAGSMNFTVPPEIDPAAYGSVVIWCERLRSAYAAASLTAPQ